MPAANTKADLVAVTRIEWGRLWRLLQDIPEDVAQSPCEGETSIKDVVSHRTHWIGLFFQWLEEGEAAQMPDHGVKWSELLAYNSGLRKTYRGVPWDEARDGLAGAHRRLLTWIEAADEATLYGCPMPGGNGWTTGRYAEAAGPSHYRSATKTIRRWLTGPASGR